MNVLGIDIGTTTISFVVLESETGRVRYAGNCPNDSSIPGIRPWERMQDPERIYKLAAGGFQKILEEQELSAIGLTGQMHGILYLNEKGRAVSPLYTWQDERAGRIFKEGKSYAEYLSKLSGYQVAAGYGCATHYYHLCNREIPGEAKVFCTIADYIAMRLTNEKTPVLHSSNGASLGLYSFEKGDFDREAMKACDLAASYFPEVTGEYYLVGNTKEGIPVAAAIGDNQASFLGSVREKDSILVNIGTGSQISYVCKGTRPVKGMEIRPLKEKEYIAVGSCLCGGRAYAGLKDFYLKFLTACGLSCPDLYDVMGEMAKKGRQERVNPLTVSTQFCGTRENPSLRGSVSNIDLVNFTPEQLTAGVLRGMVKELYEMYAGSAEGTRKLPYLVGSGNGIRRNPVLKELLEEAFQRKMKIPLYQEEAAYGAGLFALVAAGVFTTMEQASRKIPYIGENDDRA